MWCLVWNSFSTTIEIIISIVVVISIVVATMQYERKQHNEKCLAFSIVFFLPVYITRNTYTEFNVVMTCVFVDWWEIYPYQWRSRARPRGSERQRESRHDCDGITWFGNNPEDAVRKRQFLRHVSCVSSGHCLPAIAQRTSIHVSYLWNRQIIQGRQSIDIPNQTITGQVVSMVWLHAQTSRYFGIWP